MEPGRIVSTVNWESSSPPKPRYGVPNTYTAGDETPKQLDLPRLAPSSETTATHDPVDNLLEKYHIAPLLSSPPPTWPPRAPQAAQRFKSECIGTKRPVSPALRLYSPGYLKRPKAPLPRTPLKPRALTKSLIKSEESDELDLSWLNKENVAPKLALSDSSDDLDFANIVGRKESPKPTVIYPDLPDPEIRFKDSPLKICPQNPQCHRFVVNMVAVEESQVVLGCQGLKGPVTVLLKDTWRQMDMEKDDVIHIIGEVDEAGPIVLSHASRALLVLNPDLLVASTAIADSIGCERQVVLRGRLRIPVELNVAMLYGTIIHELIQYCLLENNFDLVCMETTLEKEIIDSYAENLTVLGIEVHTAVEEIKERLPRIAEWGAQVSCKGKPILKAAIHRSTRQLPVKIEGTHMVEEELWSPTYGLKGKVDATVAVSTGGPSVAAGLEIKTGASTGISTTSHRAQVMLYALLLRERYEKVLACTLIYYAKDSAMVAVRAMPDELRQLLLRRNLLVRHQNRPTRLPWHSQSLFSCRGCFRKDDCTVFTAANAEHMDPENPSLETAQELMQTAPGIWSTNQLAFFKHWDRLLVYEDLDTNRDTRDIWCIDAEAREESGKAFANLKVSLKSVSGSKVQPKYSYVCTREIPFPEPSQTRFTARQPLIVSSDKAVAEATGTLTSLAAESVEICVNARLDESLTYRVDREPGQSMLAISKYNLLRIYTQRSRLLELVVDLEAPLFDTKRAVTFPPGLNGDQEAAMRKVLQAKDYACILGMPGTGKTTTIVALVRALLKERKTVFISAVTHSAVDNIALKLLKHDVDLLRIGSPSSVNPQVRRKMAGRQAAVDPGADATNRLEQLYLNVPVVAATCLSVNHWLFARRRFDYCIVDEASQATLPACLGPIRYADRFVLVGDHYQLQPIVKSVVARKNGLSESLFERLCKAHPDAVVNLSHQYRMNRDIMNLSSTLIYDGMLKCGSDQVANQRLTLSRKVHFAPPWLQTVLDPNNSVIFLNTDEAGAPEEQCSEGVANPKEAKIVAEIVRNLIDGGGITQDQVGIISVYRVQRKLLKERLECYEDLDIMTADQAQGRDKDCVIMSLVRSNKDNRVGDLLRDWRRINVCFTRAKSKLIIVGSRTTLASAPTLEKFLKIIETNGWMSSA